MHCTMMILQFFQPKLYATLGMDVTSLCILCSTGLKCALCCQIVGKYVHNYIKAHIQGTVEHCINLKWDKVHIPTLPHS